jgi:hypothetical protein
MEDSPGYYERRVRVGLTGTQLFSVIFLIYTPQPPGPSGHRHTRGKIDPPPFRASERDRQAARQSASEVVSQQGSQSAM